MKQFFIYIYWGKLWVQIFISGCSLRTYPGPQKPLREENTETKQNLNPQNTGENGKICVQIFISGCSLRTCPGPHKPINGSNGSDRIYSIQAIRS